jgi:uncharacterized caspase-like protein
LVTVLCALSLVPLLRAEKHALLIGIAQYKDTTLPALDGPEYDVASMKKLLIDKLGFPEKNVAVLLNSKADHDGIIKALATLNRNVKPGDYVVFYYSGHGTSYGDKAAGTWGLDPNTGALLPYDIEPGSGEQVHAKLIIGKDHLRPVFLDMDQRATVYAIFDTCYSADAAKAVKAAKSRYIPPNQLTRSAKSPTSNDLDADTAMVVERQDKSDYPYKNVISLAAAGKFQKAEDISRAELGTRKTVDGNPHGQFTNALLEGMSGAADKDHDGIITHDELYSFLQEKSLKWSHTPVQQYSKDAGALLASPAFLASKRGTTPVETASGPRPVFVKAEEIPAALAERIRKLPRVKFNEGEQFDLLVKRAEGGFDLFQSGGAAINDAVYKPDALLERIAAEPDVQDLLNLSYQQTFNAALRMTPDDQSVWFQGQRFTFSARTDQPAYFLLLNIDVTGAVGVVYPYGDDKIERMTAGDFHPLGGESEVGTTYGVEYMKLVAFTDKPADYEHWLVSAKEKPLVLTPGSAEFRRLMKMLRAGNAETRQRVLTAPKR